MLERSARTENGAEQQIEGKRREGKTGSFVGIAMAVEIGPVFVHPEFRQLLVDRESPAIGHRHHEVESTKLVRTL